MTARDIGSARAMARQVIRQVVQDASFAETIRNDPRKTLLNAGFPEWAVDDFIVNDLGLESDVQGYSMDRCALTSLLWIEGDGTDIQ